MTDLPKIKIALPAQTVEVDMKDGVHPTWYQNLKLLAAFAQLFSEIDFNTMTTGQTFRWNATTQKFTAGP